VSVSRGKLHESAISYTAAGRIDGKKAEIKQEKYPASIIDLTVSEEKDRESPPRSSMSRN